MSYDDYDRIVRGFGIRFATVSGLAVVLDYEPTTVQESPLIYSVLDGFTSEVKGTTEATTWRTLHRLCIRWQDPQPSEQALREMAVAIKRAVAQDPRLGGMLVSAHGRGVAHITDADAGWITIDGILYRTLDLFSEALAYTAYPATA